ncbi:glycosyltransferase family 2 protein [Actibacterium pelagium]|uniref:Glycosyl transferase family 2 n=1 Tax=Actibacterium pelagium TaxID=2029103 RepID=A0A917AET5_9RHOB|nr:glycosyltransferase family 2 protein [Actibacterium pelagium]GGE46062.1 hypothetical protein GCM10011517_12180 [Actibacterium pelagium]
MRALAVLTVRNEGAFLLEWLAHHKAVGFTDFLILSNDCQDGTDAILDRLQDMGEIAHMPNDPPYDGGIQWAGLKKANKHPLVRQADWILTLDVDEFVNIHAGDHTLPALLAALPEAGAIPITWKLFGNAGIDRFVDEPITEQFTMAAPEQMKWPWRAAMFKTLYRNDGTYGKLGVHRPRQPDKTRLNEMRWFDGSGRELPAQIKTSRIFSNYHLENHNLVQLNHYPLGAKESYLVKCDRGRAVHGRDVLGMDYWVERNFNTVKDSSIASLRPQMQAHLNALKTDPVLSDLHGASVEWRRARFAALLMDEELRALYGRLLLTPSSQPLSKADAQFMHEVGLKAQKTSSGSKT